MERRMLRSDSPSTLRVFTRRIRRGASAIAKLAKLRKAMMRTAHAMPDKAFTTKRLTASRLIPLMASVSKWMSLAATNRTSDGADSHVFLV